MIRTLIIDDDKMHCEVLAQKLANLCPQLMVAGYATSVDDAIIMINDVQPQLVFLDVEMPPSDGFALLSSLSEINFEVIFASSHTQYAYRAIKVAAADFLHKPFTTDELLMAVKRVVDRIGSKTINPVHQLLLNIHSNTLDTVKIGLPVQNGYLYIFVKSILHIEAANNYCIFYFDDGNTELITKKMGEMEELFKDYNFFRIHQSHIINLKCVKQYIRGDGGQVKLSNDTLVNVSKKHKEAFLVAMKSI